MLDWWLKIDNSGNFYVFRMCLVHLKVQNVLYICAQSSS